VQPLPNDTVRSSHDVTLVTLSHPSHRGSQRLGIHVLYVSFICHGLTFQQALRSQLRNPSRSVASGVDFGARQHEELLRVIDMSGSSTAVTNPTPIPMAFQPIKAATFRLVPRRASNKLVSAPVSTLIILTDLLAPSNGSRPRSKISRTKAFGTASTIKVEPAARRRISLQPCQVRPFACERYNPPDGALLIHAY
jgi:hypothetical protein